MGLPKLEQPTYHTHELPVTKKRLKFRPFLVKEQKILLIAIQSKDYHNILDAINRCVMECASLKEDLPLVDALVLFLAIRAKSVGEIVTPSIKCPKCQESMKVSGDLNNLAVEYSDDHNQIIQLSDTIRIKLRYPTISTVLQNKLLEQSDDPEKQEHLLVDCLETIWDGDETYNVADYDDAEIEEFINSFNVDQAGKIANFFRTIPKVTMKVAGKCSKCNHEVVEEVRHLADFFV